tara:strand:- start:14 stop:373 length:360 start_codon:yes stop_codon:yes gene_type:complete
MIIRDTDALQSLKPSKKWVWRGSEYSGLEWLDSGTAPTEAEINTEITRLTNLEPMRLLRVERDAKLTACDWRASSDVTLPDAWKTYRQALRDLPASANPTVDSEGNLNTSSVTWPTEPS